MYLRTKRTANTYISGLIFFAFPASKLITTYEIVPIAIPSEMLYVSGIVRNAIYAGIVSVISSKLISTTALTIKKPT